MDTDCFIIDLFHPLGEKQNFEIFKCFEKYVSSLWIPNTQNIEKWLKVKKVVGYV